MAVKLLFEAMQEQAGSAAHDGIRRHQLRMREAFINILIDDIGFIQNQVALDQNRHFVVRIDHRDIFGAAHQIHVDYLKVHALFV